MNASVSGAKAPVAPLAPKTTQNASAAQVNAEVKADAKAAAAPKAPKAPAVPKESNFAKVYPETAKITILAAANPKRVGSKAHGTFSLYKDGGTVGEFLKAGGYYAALSWDVGHGFIKVG